MPFLQQREMGTPEAGLIYALNTLIQQSDWDGEYLQEGQEATKMLRAFFAHNAVRDGITADEVRLAWTALLIEDADEMLRFLTPGYATVESEQIATTFSPDMKISIVRVHSKRDPDTLRKVWTAIEFVETIMGQRLPVDEVVLILFTKQQCSRVMLAQTSSTRFPTSRVTRAAKTCGHRIRSNREYYMRWHTTSGT